jgi:hypothetical protein
MRRCNIRVDWAKPAKLRPNRIILGLAQIHSEIFHRRIILVEEPRAKVCCSAAVDHRAAHDV